MSIILPYEEDKLYKGAFIKPNGEILCVDGKHEEFADVYCNGKNYNDNFQSTGLTQEQYILFKLWQEQYSLTRQLFLSDFLVYVLAFDKVERIMNKIITTTANNPHIRFYNYYLMDWYVDQKVRMEYNKNLKIFEEIPTSHFSLIDDREAEKEILEIKSRVLYKDRPLFFRK